MNRDEAMRFLEENHQGVFCVLRKDGAPHLSPVLYALMDGKIRVSCTWDRVKTKLLRRDSRASLCVILEKFFEAYLSVEGTVRLIEDPDGRENLALYQAVNGGPPDNLDEYLAAMKEDKRLVFEMSVDRIHPVHD